MRKTSGFSLVEISIVLAVLSVVLSGLLPYMTESTKSQDSEETVTRLDEIEQALIAYFAGNPEDRESAGLPCPSDLTVGLSAAGFGDSFPGAGSNCSNGNGVSGNVVIGGVPTKALGLPDEYGFDGWGRRILYAVDVRATSDVGGSGNPSQWDNAGAITVKNDAGGTDRTTAGVFALVSLGPDGHGGITRSGQRVNAGSSNASEVDNCSIPLSGPCNAAFDAVFVKKLAQYDTPGDEADYFDDLVRYKDRRHVDRVVNGMGGDTLWSTVAGGDDIKKATNSGNVGIGLDTPTSQLHVAGDVDFDTTLNVDGATTLNNALTVTGTAMIGGETIGSLASGQGQFRMYNAGNTNSYGSLVRNDGNDTWLLLTDQGNELGGYNLLRPFRVQNNTGNVYMANGQMSVAHASGNVYSAGTITAGGHFFRDGKNISAIDDCTASDYKLSWDESAGDWSCVPISGLGSGDITEADPQVGATTNGRLCQGNGSAVTCTVTDAASWESDPQVNGVAANRVCVGTGSQVNCSGGPMSYGTDLRATIFYDQNNTGYYVDPNSTSYQYRINVDNIYIRAVGAWASSFLTSESDPQVGALTNGKWCQATSGVVRCTYDAPSGSTTTTTGGALCGCGCGCGSQWCTPGCGGSCGSCTGGNCCDGDDDFDESEADLFWQKLQLPAVAKHMRKNKQEGILH